MSVTIGANLVSLKARAKRQGWLKWIRSEADERAVLDGYYFSQSRADHVLEFGPKYLRHCEGSWSGKPFEAMPWQRDELFSPLFGWVHKSDEWGKEVRRYKKAYVQVPKKNGKSPTGAYIGLYMLVGDGEGGPKVYSAATAKEQASIVHDHAINMVDESPKLSALLKINRSTRNIAYGKRKGYYRVLSSDTKTNEGWNAHCIIADELHKWHGRELFDALKWAFASRAEPLFFMITTAGDDTLSVCKEQRDYAIGISNGTFTDHSYFGLVYEADSKDDISSEATWAKANPSLGHTIKLSDFRSDFNEARQNPSLLEKFKQLRLNMWTTARRSWFTTGAWDRCERSFSDHDLEGRLCWAGLDLGLTNDMSALSLVFPDEELPEKFRQLIWYWLPEATAEAAAGIVPYKQWAENEFLTLTPGSETDFAWVKRDIAAIANRFEIAQLLYDPMYATQLTQQLEADTTLERVEFPQRLMMFAQPCAMFERFVIARTWEHNGHPILAWNVANASLYQDCNGNKRPIKPANGDHRKIDGLVATLMALGGALKGEGGIRRSYYDDDEAEVETI